MILSSLLVISNVPSGAFDYLADLWEARGIVDEMWLSQHDPSVIDSFIPRQVDAAEASVDGTVNTTVDYHQGSGKNIVCVDDTNCYVFYVNSDSDLEYQRSTNGGASWGGTSTEMDADTILGVSVWYDRWTPGDTSGTLVHIAYIDGSPDVIYYAYFNTATQAFSAPDATVINSTYPQGSLAAANMVTITKAIGGDLFIGTVDATAPTSPASFIHKCNGTCTTDSNWTSTSLPNPWTNTGSNVDNNHALLMLPLSDTTLHDAGDVMLVSHDIAAHVVEYKYYDDSANSWSGDFTSLGSSTDSTTYDAALGGTVNPNTGELYITYVYNPGTANTSEVLAWKYHDADGAGAGKDAWSKLTDPWDNSTDAASIIIDTNIGIDTNTDDLYVAYIRADSTATANDVYYRVSTNDGSSWGTETLLSSGTDRTHIAISLDASSPERLYGVWFASSAMYGNLIADLSAGITITGTFHGTSESGGDPGQCDGATENLSLRVDGGTAVTTTCADTTGTFSFTGISAGQGDTITIYSTGADKANRVYVSDGTDDSGMDIYEDRVAIGDENDGTVTNADLADYDNGGVEGTNDMLFDVDGSNNLTVDSGKELHIHTGDTFSPGSNVTTPKLHVTTSATYSGSSETLTLTGSGTTTDRPLYIDGGTFTAPATTVFQGTSATDIESTTFNALTFSPTITGSVTYTFLGAETINGNFTINPTAASTQLLTVNAGGTITVGASYTTTLSGTTSGTSTLDLRPSAADYNLSSGLINIGAAGTLDASSTTTSTITLTGTSGTLFTRSGVFTAGGSTIIFNGDGSPTALTSGTFQTTNAFNNLTLTPAISSAGRTYAFGSGAIAVGGDLTIQPSGTQLLTVNMAGDITVTDTLSITRSNTATSKLVTGASNPALSAGDINVATGGTLDGTGSTSTITLTENGTPLVIGGTYTPGNTTIAYVPSGTSGVAVTSGTYYNVTFNKASNTFSLTTGGITVSNDLTIIAGVLDAVSGSNYPITVGRNWTNTPGTGGFLPQNGTVTFNTTTTAEITGATNFYNFTAATAGKTLKFGDATTFTINGLFTLTGAAGPSYVTLDSVSGGTSQWTINHQGTESITYASVKNSACDGSSTQIDASDVSNYDAGNNGTCWLFPSLTPSAVDFSMWKFDEGYGDTAYDSDASAFNGTLSGTTKPTWQTEDLCVFEKCLYFEGSTAYVDVGDVDTVKTVSFWARPISTTTSFVQLSTSAYISASSGTLSATGFTEPTFYVNGQPSKTIVANRWQHIVVTTSTGVTADAVQFGKQNSSYFTGFLDEVKLMADTYSAAEVRGDYTANGAQGPVSASFGGGGGGNNAWLSDGLVGYWQMDQEIVSAGYPEVASKGTTYNSASDTTDHVVDLPDSISAGDLLMIFVAADGNASWTWPGDWDVIIDTDSGGSSHIEVGYKTATGSDGTSITITSSSAESATAFSWRITGWDGTTPPEGTTYVPKGLGDPPNPPSHTASWGSDNNLWITFSGTNGGTDGTSVYPYPDNNENAENSTSGGNIASDEVTTATQNPGTFTQTYINYWVAATIVVRPESSTTITDFSGNNIALNNNGGVTTVAGKFGNGSEYVPASTQYLSTTTAINDVKSISFWVNPDSTTNYYLALTSSAYITSSGGQFALTGFGSADIYVNGKPSTTIEANKWSLVTITSQTSINANQFYLGRQGTNYFDGTMDEVRLYNRVLSPAEVAALYEHAPGPVAHWKMDENTGSYAYDSSVNSLTATLTNASWNLGKFGSGVKTTDANSVQEYVSLLDQNTLDFTNAQNYSLSGWVKVESQENTVAILMNKGGTSTSTAGYDMYVSTNYRCGYTDGDGSGVDYAESSVAADSNWHHVSCVMDRDGVATGIVGLHVFVDGVLSGSDTTLTEGDGGTGNSSSFVIGEHSTTYEYTSSIDDVKVYNYARTPKQIVEDMNGGHPAVGSPVGSPVGYWKFDEGSLNMCSGGSNDFCDQSGQGNDLAFSTTTSGFTNDGKFGKAFNGTGIIWASISDVDSGDKLDFAAADSFAISGWIRSDGASNPGGNEYIINKANATTAGYAVYANSFGQVCFGIDDDTSWAPDAGVCSVASLYNQVWHHFVAVRDIVADEIVIYVNGLPVKTATDTTSATLANSLAFYLADRDGTDNGDEFNGDIDELRVYRYALQPSEVLVDYNQGKAAVMGSLSQDTSGDGLNSAASEYCPPGNSDTCAAPIAEWKMDEKTGTNVNDTSGNNYTAAFTGTPTWAIGKYGSALNFPGSDSHYAVTASNVTPSSTISMSFWMKSTSTSTTQVLLDWRLGRVCRIGGVTANKINCMVDDSSSGSATSTTSVNDGKWHHVVLTSTANAQILYIDGKPEGTATETLSTTTGVVYLGRATSATYPYDGLLDNVRLYNYVRTPEQIAWEYNQGAPVAWYKFDECADTTAYNSAVDGNGDAAGLDGTITPGDTTGTNDSVGTCSSGNGDEMWDNGTVGKYSGSLDFDGTNDYVTIASPGLPSGDFTYSVWFYHSANSSDTILYAGDGAGGNEMKIDRPASNEVRVRLNGSAACLGGPVPETNTWNHFMVTRTGSAVQGYLNGVPSCSGISAATLNFGSCPLLIGADDSSTACDHTGISEVWDGQIDEVKIFNHALTPQQVQLEYNGGAVRFN